jgi:predicted phosphate transport protein (TIGR00153 family)
VTTERPIGVRRVIASGHTRVIPSSYDRQIQQAQEARVRGDKIVKFFMPKEERFHELLDKDTQHLLSSARLFLEIAKSTSLDDRRAKVAQLKALEHDGDIITRDIFNALNSTFITPLDREDIRTIATDLDDILDYMEGVAQYLILFEIKESPEPLRKFAEIIVAMVEEIHKATSMVWDLSNEKQIQDAIVRISVLENEADAVYFGVIADLFKEGSGKTPVEILKWKEIYQGLEDACDECKEFTHVLGNVVIKNA